MLLLLRKPCNTKLACRSVSSSFSLSPANTGRIINQHYGSEEARQSFPVNSAHSFFRTQFVAWALPFLFKVLARPI